MTTEHVNDGSLDYRDSTDDNYTIFMRCPVCGDEHLISEVGVCSKG